MDRRRQRATSEAVEQEIKHEQAVVDRIYARLEAATRAAHALQADGHARARLGNEGGLVERDAIVFQAAKRLASLSAAHDGLVFGRLDTRDHDVRYIGRLGLRDEDREVLLVDWRAPAASVFYQATAQDPAGVVRRRVLQSLSDQIVGVEDDLLDPAHAPDDMVVVGEGALLAALARSRDRSMHSVVTTIQREQDDAIRSPHKGVTTISGGPGTGKTVVALHRAAYLLYTDRRRYEGGGVLVVGPNAVFMAYIERVLPSLGETSVSMRALGDVVAGITATRHDTPAVALIKGSSRMRGLLSAVARGAVPGAPTQFRLFYRDDVLTLGEQQLGRFRRELLDRWRRRNHVVPHVADELIELLWRQVDGDRALSRGKDEFAHTLYSDRAFLDFVRGWWPVVDAVDVLGWLSDVDRLAHDAAGTFTAHELDDLVDSFTAHGYAIDDVPLLDELRYQLGERSAPEDDHDPLSDLYDETVPELSTVDARWSDIAQDGRDGQRPSESIEDDGYAHVLIDEAQDLSPMQWRMLGRRGRSASWTIVGDAAQSSWSLTEEATAARAEALGDKDQHSF
ncbi:MAG: UvrD-helicase domain-containing protein, partial [Propionibacteriales bacterium]|nr:UvrD-helicase domain-containing protein [Propionibacteriales bacterium]